jgi:two-component sensor histidine kinase
VTNAYKYAYPGEARGDIRVTISRNDAQACLSVEDDGIGWPRANSAPGGTGLGTRVIRSMSISLGAELLYPETGRGTRAELRFAV